jgi:glycosyltransferase involved in cell wall biosynthesis
MIRVCYFGTYRAEYARNQILIEGLRRNDVEVIECHELLWYGVDDRVATAKGGWKNPDFLWRLIKVYLRLLKRYQKVQPHDIIIVGYPGHFDVFLARILSIIHRKPLVWDILNSLFLITQERGLHDEHPITGWMIRNEEKIACRVPDMMLLDTKLFVQWFNETHNVDVSKFRLVQIGADDRYFQPSKVTHPAKDHFEVIYYGSYIPNHGVDTIIEAANILSQDKVVHFKLIGTGPDYKKAQTLARNYQLQNVTFIDWLDREDLVFHIADADLVLGVFGATIQNQLTNNNKIYEAFAMKKPVISADSPALPAVLNHQEHLYLCQRGDPKSLADGILELKNNPNMCDVLAQNGYRIFNQYFNIAKIGKRFSSYLIELLADNPKS